MRSGSFQRAYGALLLVFGLIAIVTPFSSGGWAISILALIVLVAGAVGIIQGLRNAIAVFDVDDLSQACSSSPADCCFSPGQSW